MKNGQSFYYWLIYDAKYIPRNTINGIQNLCRYFKVIWKDNSWGSYTTFELLKTKLKYIAKDVSEADYYVGWERDVERINTCIRLIEKLQDEYYATEYLLGWNSDLENYKTFKTNKDFSYLFKKYSRIKKYIINNPGDKNVFYYKNINDDVHTLAMSICQFNEQRANKLLFRLIEENIYSWGW